MRKILFHPDAENEWISAVDYYKACDGGLADLFVDETLKAILNVVDFPCGMAKIRGKYTPRLGQPLSIRRSLSDRR